MIGDELYRYAVRCNRTKYEAIEKAAKRAGLTANQFVQAHFETILDERRKRQPETVAEPVSLPDDGSLQGDLARARKAGLTLVEYQLHRAMAARMDAQRLYADGAAAIGDPLGIDQDGVRSTMSRMKRKGVIDKVHDSAGRPIWGVWLVNPLSEAQP